MKPRISIDDLHMAIRKAIRSCLCSALLAAWTTIAGAAEFTVPVVSVLDGDTLEVLHNQHPERIRLRGIDCPEKDQAYGKKAKQFTQPGPILCTIAR
jgi:endonuclease YncB( thermonuclease family)